MANQIQTINKKRVTLTIVTIVVLAVVAFGIYYIAMLGTGFLSM